MPWASACAFAPRCANVVDVCTSETPEWEGDQVVGVRTTDVGVDAKGQPRGNFTPGMDLKAKVTAS